MKGRKWIAVWLTVFLTALSACGGDAGVDGRYLFVEKLAFGDPFRITVVQDEGELVQMLAARPDYSADGETVPVVFRNQTCIGTLGQGGGD